VATEVSIPDRTVSKGECGLDDLIDAGYSLLLYVTQEQAAASPDQDCCASARDSSRETRREYSVVVFLTSFLGYHLVVETFVHYHSQLCLF
jgi:hypothetical protein